MTCGTSEDTTTVLKQHLCKLIKKSTCHQRITNTYTKTGATWRSSLYGWDILRQLPRGDRRCLPRETKHKTWLPGKDRLCMSVTTNTNHTTTVVGGNRRGTILRQLPRETIVVCHVKLTIQRRLPGKDYLCMWVTTSTCKPRETAYVTTTILVGRPSLFTIHEYHVSAMRNH